MQVYLVGGAVRDHLLGHPYHEKDYVVVGATPEQLLALGYQPVGKDFPVFLHPESKELYLAGCSIFQQFVQHRLQATHFKFIRLKNFIFIAFKNITNFKHGIWINHAQA